MNIIDSLRRFAHLRPGAAAVNITESIRQFAHAAPDATAVIRADGTALSWREFDLHIDRYARRAIYFEVQAGNTVGISISGRDDALGLVMALSLARIGAATSDLNLPRKYLALTFLQSGQRPPPNLASIVFADPWVWNEEPKDSGPPRIHADRKTILRVFSTPGPTAAPRRSPVSHADMIVRIRNNSHPVVSADGPTVLACAMNIGGEEGFRACLTTLLAGGTVVFAAPDALIDAIHRHAVTSLAISPETLSHILDIMPPDLAPPPSLRTLIVSGGPLRGALAHIAAERICANIITTFGYIETGTVCAGRYDACASIPHAVGIVSPDMEVQAVDENDRPSPPGTEGWLRVRGPGTIAQYLDDDAATSASFRDGWFYPGDRGAITADRVMIVAARAATEAGPK